MTTTPDRITVRMGKSLNIGNYESLRVDVEYSSDREPKETLRETQERVLQQTRALLEYGISEAEESFR
ncbi:MAG: hypothetical protein EHM36_05345 [Deltaproteobacteria bacterium]|nr:MAG: hypothetical protein EHM36_05345 [Deltaproteobacteria bacterium]